MTRFTGLTQDLFAVYVPEKWSSNVHNLPRMRNKDVLLALCDQAQTLLSDELTGLQRSSSDEIPTIVNHKKVDAQWVFWFRDASARAHLASFLEKTPLTEAEIFNIAPQDKHVTLALVVRQNHLWVGVRLSPQAVVDRKNVASKYEKSWERERFMALLANLPEQCQVGFEGETVPVKDVSMGMLETWGTRMGHTDPAWSLGVSLTPEEAATMGADLASYLAQCITAYAPVYRFACWTRDNDQIEATKQIQEEKHHKRKHSTAFNTGDKVKITSGLFMGKTGIVQETDTKAQVKVLVGKMSVVLNGTDLTPAS
jgi:transcription antitermination factor NusG